MTVLTRIVLCAGWLTHVMWIIWMIRTGQPWSVGLSLLAFFGVVFFPVGVLSGLYVLVGPLIDFLSRT